MNLNVYDNVKEKLDKTKSWIDIKRQLLLSREIKYRRYCSLLKRYNKKTNSYLYYIAILDKPDANKICSKVNIDNYGRVKINIKTIWKELEFTKLKRDTNIDIEYIENDDNGEIYQINI